MSDVLLDTNVVSELVSPNLMGESSRFVGRLPILG